MIEADRVLAGEWKYFSHEWIKTGFPPDWHIDPVSGVKLGRDQTLVTASMNTGIMISSLSGKPAGWSMVYTLMRAYAHHRDERYAEAFWQLVEDWMDKNPPGLGANWIDGQEAALRLLALCFGYFAFRKAEVQHCNEGYPAYHSGRGTGKKDRPEC